VPATNVIVVPDIGDFKNVPVVEVLVKVGDDIELETPLITLETEKATLDVPATAAGRVVAVKLRKGDKVSQGAPIVELAAIERAAGDAPVTAPRAPEPKAPRPAATKPDDVETGSEPTVRHPALRAREDAAAARPAAQAGAKPAAASTPRPSAMAAPPSAPGTPEYVETHVLAPSEATAPAILDEVGFAKSHASPSVRQFARELGVELARVRGSGLKGRVTQEDVKSFVKSVLTGERAAVAAPAPAWPAVPKVDFARFGAIEVKPLTRIQKIAGPRLHASWVNIPHVTQFDEADITDLEALRNQLKTKAVQEGIKLTPLAFVLKACVRALAEFPLFASSLDAGGQNLVYKKYIHLGFAADTPNGLVVPVIRDADRKDIYEIARELAALSAKARDGKLSPGEMQGGVFTVSSLGSIGGTAFTPIINAPEVAILGVARATMKPVYQNGSFVPRLMLPLALSYDHRVIDGAVAVRFTTFLAKILNDARALTEAIP
jgi:pyruvate dehydrogenase E2 component (dihydrolipoamide acetyltransferase)